jgi:hypothetical protein
MGILDPHTATIIKHTVSKTKQGRGTQVIVKLINCYNHKTLKIIKKYLKI